MNIFITPDARVCFLDNGKFDASGVGIITRDRASHIFPENRFKRAVFWIIRKVSPEHGLLSRWSRTWKGPWIAVIKGTGLAFKHEDRNECISWEHDVIEELLGRVS